MAEVALPEPLPPIKGIEGLRARLPRWEPAILLWLLLVAVLLFLVINPLLRLLITSFQATDTQSFTLANYGLAFGRLRNVTALVNSLLYGAAVTLVSICFAVPIAFAISRTDMPSKGFVRAVVVGAFITPSYLGAVAWIPRGAECRLAELGLDGAHRQQLRAVRHLQLQRIGAGHGAVRVPLRVRLHERCPRHGLVGDGGGSPDPGGRACLDDVQDNVAARDTCDTRRCDRRVPRHHRAVRNPGHYRTPGAHQHHDAAVVAVLRVPRRRKRLPHIRCPLNRHHLPSVLDAAAGVGRKSYVALTGKSPGRQLIKAGAFRWVLLGWSLFVCALAVLLPFAALGQAAFARAWGKGLSLSDLAFPEISITYCLSTTTRNRRS